MYYQTHPPKPCPPRNPHCGDTPGLSTVPSLIPLFMAAIILGVFIMRKTKPAIMPKTIKTK